MAPDGVDRLESENRYKKYSMVNYNAVIIIIVVVMTVIGDLKSWEYCQWVYMHYNEYSAPY